MSDDKALALATLESFHGYFSTPPPFTEGSRYTLPRGLITVPLPREMGGLTTEHFEDMFERVSGLLAKARESGASDFKHYLSEPAAKVWVSGDIAAVFVGWSASMAGRGEFLHTVNVCTLHRLSNESSAKENPWRISGLVDMEHLAPDVPTPSVETGPLSEITAPLEALLSHIKAQEWDAVSSLLLPGAGATRTLDSQTPETLMWPEYMKQLQVEAQGGSIAETKLVNCEARRCGDLAFVWAPYMTAVDGSEVAKGVIACSFRREEGAWLISGLHETKLTK